MDWQTVIAYALVAAAAAVSAVWLVRAVRGKTKLPACPGCKMSDVCEKPEERKEERC